MTAKKAVPRPKIVCCKAWTDVGHQQRALWAWQVLHEYAHSRIPFSVATFASTARIEREEAVRLIAEGVSLKWLHLAGHTYFGRLTKKR